MYGTWENLKILKFIIFDATFSKDDASKDEKMENFAQEHKVALENKIWKVNPNILSI